MRNVERRYAERKIAGNSCDSVIPTFRPMNVIENNGIKIISLGMIKVSDPFSNEPHIKLGAEERPQWRRLQLCLPKTEKNTN